MHEIANEMLHRGERRTLTTKQVRETEAEAVAFVVCQSASVFLPNRLRFEGAKPPSAAFNGFAVDGGLFRPPP